MNTDKHGFESAEMYEFLECLKLKAGLYRL